MVVKMGFGHWMALIVLTMTLRTGCNAANLLDTDLGNGGQLSSDPEDG